MGLTEKEIKQFHNNFKVTRKHKIAGVNFVIESMDWGKEGDFVKTFNEFEDDDIDIYIKNRISEAILEQCLISFDGKAKSAEEISNFSPEKTNYILDKYKQLSSDIEEYLEGFPFKEISDKEIEEYILTDDLKRNVTLSYDEDTANIQVKFKVLNVKENKEIGRKIRDKIEEEEAKTNIHLQYINETEYILKMVEEINGLKLNENNLKGVGVELVKFILQRITRLEEDITNKLNDPEGLGESLKN